MSSSIVSNCHVCSIGGGELFDRVIQEEFVLSEKACCIFTKQILEGVSYIHRQGIIHLDLKVSGKFKKIITKVASLSKL